MGIEWCEETWNPSSGCTKVSPGCHHCYAETFARRLKAMGLPEYKDGFKLAWHPDRLVIPLQRKKPTIYFVNSMSDLFHEKLSTEFIDRVFAVIEKTPRHTYQILTKRPGVMRDYFKGRPVPANVWLGVSVEDQKYGCPRIEILRELAAPVRFLSAEPLLEDLGVLNLRGIHWVIVGGESGAKARPMRPEWVENIKQQCALAGTRFFFKQWGSIGPDGVRRSKKANGRIYAGREWNERPITLYAQAAINQSN